MLCIALCCVVGNKKFTKLTVLIVCGDNEVILLSTDWIKIGVGLIPSPPLHACMTSCLHSSPFRTSTLRRGIHIAFELQCIQETVYVNEENEVLNLAEQKNEILFCHIETRLLYDILYRN